MMQVVDPDQVIAAAFRELLRTRAAVSTTTLAATLGAGEPDIRQAVAGLLGRGRMCVADGGDVVGAAGLSVVPSRHELLLEGHRFWTWCASDALGILGALRASGTVHTRDPQNGRDLRVAVTGGAPDESATVLFMVDLTTFTSTHDEWCPLVNLFESERSARTWVAARGLSGSVLPVAEATSRGALRWARLVPGGAGRGEDGSVERRRQTR
jgi:hypothetical protein